MESVLRIQHNVARSLINLAVLALLSGDILVQQGQCETRVGGIISTEARWEPENAPYVITRDILVTRSGRLTIAPGTRIVVGKPLLYDDSIPQEDGLDSQLVSIKVNGQIHCTGRMQNRIAIASMFETSEHCAWYGILVENPIGDLNEIAFTDISGACNALIVRNAELTVRNCLVEFNNTGLRLERGGNASIYNSIIAHNFTSAVVVTASNPTFSNCIIAYNNNMGMWCDGVSKTKTEYSCFYGNGDGNFMDCDPQLGVLTHNKKGETDSTDSHNNLFRNPLFNSAPAEHRDVTNESATQLDLDSATYKPILPRDRYRLSPKSPCRDAGDPDKAYRDMDGTRADMGIFGNQEFLDPKK